MDSTHLHLMLNHFPIIGTLLGVGIMLYGYMARSTDTQKAALYNWVLMALIAIPVFLTGEPAEESVEHLAGISETLIEQHESAAQLALAAMEALGLLSLIALLGGMHKKGLVGGAFILGLLTFGLMARTGYLGGQIRHTEIQTVAITPTEGGNTAKPGESEDDD